MQKNRSNRESCFKIIPLGGINEVGRNSWIFSFNDEWIIVDYGMGFTFGEIPGVEVVYPDISYITENQDKIKAFIVSHAHEDHIGGACTLLEKINIPVVYASKLTTAILKRRLEDANKAFDAKIMTLSPKETINIGSIDIELIRITHSVPDCLAICFKTPIGNVLFSSDFKFDFKPVDNENFDIQRIAQLSNEGIKLLISDSTNIERTGFSQSESTVGPNLLRIFQNCKGRIFISSFSSHIHRIQQIINAACKLNKKICILGYSIETFTAIAKENNYLQYDESSIISAEDIKKYPNNEIVIITTGSQGEINSTFARLSRNEHKNISVIPGDTFIFSAHPIPGNERSVSKLQDTLARMGANLIYGRNQNIHVSGHGSKDELQLLINLSKPEYFLPSHGDYRMILQHAELASECGINPENIFLIQNGDALEIYQNSVNVTKNLIEAKPVYLDSILGGIVSDNTIKERQILAQEGLITVNLVFSKDFSQLFNLKIDFIGVSDPEGTTITVLKDELLKTIKNAIERMIKAKTAQENNIKIIIRDILSKSLDKRIFCSPMQIINLIKIDN